MSKSDKTNNQLANKDADRGPNHSLLDYVVQEVGEDSTRIGDLNAFFNSPQIKSELHWFTHRDTLERAASRSDRRLYYFAPFGEIIGGLMVWCESRVLDPGQGQIRLVAVDTTYRGLDIGESLVGSAIEFAQAQGKSEMIADVAEEAAAVAFWRSCGFERKSEYDTSGGRTMFRWSRSI